MEGGGGEEGDRIGLEAPACLFCGEPELLDIGDIWADGAYTLDTCCPGLLECVCAEMHDDPAWGRDLLRRLGAELLTGQRLRRVCDDNGFTTMLDFKLQVRPISFRDAAQFVGRHHSHSRPPLTWRFGFGVWNGRALLMGVFYGVALSSYFDETAPAFFHKSPTHGLDRSDCRRAASPRPHAGLR